MNKWLQQNTDLKTLDELEGRINHSIEEKLKEKVDVKEMEEMCKKQYPWGLQFKSLCSEGTACDNFRSITVNPTVSI